MKDRDIYGIRGICWSWLWCLSRCTQACTHASVPAHYFLAILGPYLSQLGLIREIKVYTESGDHARPLFAHNMTRACKLACRQTVCLRAQAHSSAKSGPIREIKISMESGEQSGPLWAHVLTQACKFVCMHSMCLRAQAQIGSDKTHQSIYGIRRTWRTSLSIKFDPCTQACVHARYVLGPISQPNWVRSERWRYLWNMENIPDLSEYIMWTKHTR